jgi:hypothetical protein
MITPKDESRVEVLFIPLVCYKLLRNKGAQTLSNPGMEKGFVFLSNHLVSVT